MSDYNKTRLECSDSEKFFAIMMKNSFFNSEMQFSNNVAYIESRNRLPEKEIEIISKEFPELIFTAEYSFEDEGWETTHIVEYKNGESREVRCIPIIDRINFENLT